jgi:hypothetical protein
MRKLVTSVAIGTLLSVGCVAPAMSAIKAGDACKKVGATAVAKGYKYTCITQGKKKVWGKATKIVAPTTAQPTPTPTPTQAPAPSPTPKLTLAQQWSATGSRAMEGYEKAFPQQAARYPEIEIVWRISESVNPIISAEIQKQYKESAAFWSAFTKHEGVLQVIVGTLDDIAFVCKWRSEYLMMSDSGCASGIRQDKTRVWDAHTTQFNGKATDFYFMTDPAALKNGDFWPRVPHEFFHNVQYAQALRYKYVLPCWAEEAGAEYFGMLVASQGTPDKFLSMRIKLITDRRGLVKQSPLKEADWKAWLVSTDMNSLVDGKPGWGCESVQMEGIYSYGFMATEYLNLRLGISGLLALYKDAGLIGWDRAIEKAFGKSKSEAYDEIALYMKNEYDIGVNQKVIRQ